MRLQLGPTESCRIRDMSKPPVQITHVHALLLQNGSPAAAGQLVGSHVAYWLAASGSSLCPCEHHIITNPRFRRRFYYVFYGKKCQKKLHPPFQECLWIFLSPNTYFGVLKGRCLEKKQTIWSFQLSLCSLPKHRDVSVYVHVRGGK